MTHRRLSSVVVCTGLLLACAGASLARAAAPTAVGGGFGRPDRQRPLSRGGQLRVENGPAALVRRFNDGFQGSAPDMGAYEKGAPKLEFGVNAYRGTSPPSLLPTVTNLRRTDTR